jgi:hypothetical protein
MEVKDSGNSDGKKGTLVIWGGPCAGKFPSTRVYLLVNTSYLQNEEHGLNIDLLRLIFGSASKQKFCVCFLFPSLTL